jgi:phosphatidylglycerophosphate synthase
MFDEPFRARFQSLVEPLVRRLGRTGATPNQITITSFAIAVTAAAIVAAGHPIAGIVVWLVSRIGDGLDGALARAAGRSTAYGGFLDITLDMAAYAGMVLGFAHIHPELTVAWAAVLFGYVLVITTTLALSDAAGALGRKVSDTERTFQFTPGLTEAGETNVMYALWAIFPDHVYWLVWLWVAALVATAMQRTYLAWQVLR